MKKVKCKCGVDITTMKNVNKVGMKYTCKKCGKNITKKKLNQLIDSIKEGLK